MVHATPGWSGGWPGDPLTKRTYPTFFQVLELLLGAGVTVVAEATFQDKVWRHGLEKLEPLAKICVIRCSVDPAIAHARAVRRFDENPVRRAHADALAPQAFDQSVERYYKCFAWLTLEAPTITVDTSDGYVPTIAEIVDFMGQ